MSAPSHSAHRSHHRWMTLLKGGLVAGAVYDLAFAAAMAFIPEFSAELLGLRLPADPFYLQLTAVLLTMLAAVYLLAAYDPVAYSGNILVGMIGRGVGFVVLLVAAIKDPSLPALYLLALGDLTFALLHAVAWFPLRR